MSIITNMNLWAPGPDIYDDNFEPLQADEQVYLEMKAL